MQTQTEVRDKTALELKSKSANERARRRISMELEYLNEEGESILRQKVLGLLLLLDAELEGGAQ